MVHYHHHCSPSLLSAAIVVVCHRCLQPLQLSSPLHCLRLRAVTNAIAFVLAITVTVTVSITVAFTVTVSITVAIVVAVTLANPAEWNFPPLHSIAACSIC
jgi:hypothetical protein